MRNVIELNAPPTPRSALVFEGPPLPADHLEVMRDQLHRAVADESRWPIVISSKTPVYWLALNNPTYEFTKWLVESYPDVSVSDIIGRAKLALDEEDRATAAAAEGAPE